MLPARFGFLALLACCVSLATASKDETCADERTIKSLHREIKIQESTIEILDKLSKAKDERIEAQEKRFQVLNASGCHVVQPPSPPGLPPMPATPPSNPLPPSPPPRPPGPPSPPMSPPFPLTPDGLPCLRWTEDEEDPRLCRNYYSRNTALESPDHDDDGGGGGGDGSDGSCPAGFKEASREPLWWDTCKKNNHLEGASWGGNKEGGKCDNPNAPKFGVIPPPCGTCKEPSPTAGPLDKCGCSNSNGVCAIACGYPKLKTAADVKSKCPARPCTNMTSAALNCTAAQRLECSNPTEGKNMCVQKAAGHCELDKCAEAFFRTDDYNCCPGNFYDKKQIAGLKCPNEKKDKEHLKKYKVAHCNNPLGCEEGAFDVSALSDCGAVTVNHASGLPVTLNNSNINVKTFDVVCDNACKCNPKGLEPGQGLYSPPRCRVGGQDYASAIDTCYCDGNTRAYDMSHTAVDLCGYQLPIFGKTIPGGQANAYKAYALANGLKNNFPDDLFCKPK